MNRREFMQSAGAGMAAAGGVNVNVGGAGSAAAPECAGEQFLRQPLRFGKALWPSVDFYREQRLVIESVERDDETFVVAANKMGKDFVAAFIILWFFLTRTPCRIVTTSAKEDHLRVLWGEMTNFVAMSRVPLEMPAGPLLVTHHELRKFVKSIPDARWDRTPKRRCRISYCRGMVAGADSIAAMGGHHVPDIGDGIPRTLFVADEASSVPSEYYDKARTWAQRMLIIGNAWESDGFFKRAFKGDPRTGEQGGNIIAA